MSFCPSSNWSHEFPEVTGNKWRHSFLRQQEQSHEFLICSDTILSLSVCVSLSVSRVFFYFFIFCCFHQHPVHWPQFDLHPAERHYTWDHEPQVLSLPLRLCVAVCFCVCKPETPLRCSRASGVRSLCHMCGGGVDRRGSVIHWPSAFSKRLFCSHTLIVHCMKLIALLLKSSGCHLTTVSCAHRSMGSSIRHLVDI